MYLNIRLNTEGDTITFTVEHPDFNVPYTCIVHRGDVCGTIRALQVFKEMGNDVAKELIHVLHGVRMAEANAEPSRN